MKKISWYVAGIVSGFVPLLTAWALWNHREEGLFALVILIIGFAIIISIEP